MMCSFVGMANFKNNILPFRSTLEKMNHALSKPRTNEEGYFEKEHILLGHKKQSDINSLNFRAANDSQNSRQHLYYCV